MKQLGLALFAVMILLPSCTHEGEPTSSEQKALGIRDQPAPDYQINKGLWGVRRNDLPYVRQAGFRAVRPPINESFDPDHPSDNYQDTHLYAAAAQQAGFSRLIYDSGLKMMFEEMYKWQILHISPRWGLPSTTDSIKLEIVAHLDRIRQTGGWIDAYPYVDEPDNFGTAPYYYEGTEVWGQWLGDDAWDCSYVREFSSLLQFTDSIAHARGTHLIIVSTTPELLVGGEGPGVLSQPDPSRASYYYNQRASELIASKYWWPEKMNEILGKMQLVYPGKSVSQIMNYFDHDFAGCRFSCSHQDVINQVATNSLYSTWHWFYEGEFILQNVDVIHYNPPPDHINSVEQWNMLLYAIWEIEHPDI